MQTQAPSTHAPCPKQSPLHVLLLQDSPPNPSLHTQTPFLPSHLPLPEHSLPVLDPGQNFSAHAGGLKPSLHSHLVLFSTHLPWPLQLFSHLGMEQSSPR